MVDETTDGAKAGMTLILFVALIGLAIIAFFAGKELAGTGVHGLEAVPKKLDETRFYGYNNKVVRGSAVKRALNTFKDEEIIILVHTLKDGDITGTAGTAVSLERGINEARTKDDAIVGKYSNARTSDKDALERVVTVRTPGNKTLRLDTNKDVAASSPVFMNYNAVAKDSDKNHVSINKDGGYMYDADLVLNDETSSVMYNNQTRYITKKGSPEYISDSGKFDASLIRNSGDEIVGIVFSQKNLNP